jgi:diguanylate cyclase (GGDEF)-like protein
VLTDFASVVRRCVGGGDVFGRWGGEEFALFAADADLAAAWRLADEIRRAFAELGIRHDDRTIVATVSVGVAAVPMIEPDLDRLIASADAGLYLAKAQGRNRVMEAQA